MPAPKRPANPALIEQLLAQPHRFEFIQAVRVLEDSWRAAGASEARDELLSKRLRIRNSLSLAFPASEIESLRAVEADDPGAAANDDPAASGLDTASPVPGRVEIVPAFMGLLGAIGTLPSHYSEFIARRETFHKDRAARAFLDIFQQRAVTLFYKAWFKHRLPERYALDRDLEFLPQVLALVGLGAPALRHRLQDGAPGSVSDETMAFFGGFLQAQCASATQLERVLTDYFGVRVEAESFKGRWFDLPKDARTCLGLGHCGLGSDALVGDRVWQRDLRVGLRIGPLSRRDYLDFLPGGGAALGLERLLRMVTGVAIEYDVQLILRAEDVRAAQLPAPGGAALDGEGPALGLDAFLLTAPATTDRQDTRYTLLAA